MANTTTIAKKATATKAATATANAASNEKLLKELISEVRAMREDLDEALDAIQMDTTIIEAEVVKLQPRHSESAYKNFSEQLAQAFTALGNAIQKGFTTTVPNGK